MPTQKIDPKVIFASNAPSIDKPPVFSDKTKGWDVARANDGRPTIKEMNKVQQDTDLKILWLNENSVTPYDASIDYPEGAVAIKDGSFKQLASGAWVEFLDDFANKDDVKRGIANRYDSSLTYNSGDRVVLTNGDIVKSTINGNTNDPNVDMTGWMFGDNTVESIADLLAIQNPKNGSRIYVKSYHAGKNTGGGQFKYNSSKASIADGVHCFNGWERIGVNKNYVDTDIAGFFGDGSTDDYPAFMRVKSYLNSLEIDAYKVFFLKEGVFSVRSLDSKAYVYEGWATTTLIPTHSNSITIGMGKDKTKISYDFNYIDWMYTEFSDNYVKKPWIIANYTIFHATCLASGGATVHNYTVKNALIEGFSVDYHGETYYYSQADSDAHQAGNVFCPISMFRMLSSTTENIAVKSVRINRNPAMQNIAVVDTTTHVDNVEIYDVEHLYCGESSSVNNKCPDHSSIYCSGLYTKIHKNKFVGSRQSTINCAIEFHGNGVIQGNEFTDCAAPLYVANLQGFGGGTYFDYPDNVTIDIRDNIVKGAIYGIGYANGGRATINLSNNTFILRKEKSNSTWVQGRVFVHSGIDARGLINLSETVNSYTKLTSHGDTWEQELGTEDWTTEDKYINACISTKNIQELTVTNATFKNFKGSLLVLEKPTVLQTFRPEIVLSGNTYINCGTPTDSTNQNLVTDALVYISNANILDFTDANTNTIYGTIDISNETFVNCSYTQCIAQFRNDTLFTKASVKLKTNGMFLTPSTRVTPYAGNDSYTSYKFDLDFGIVDSLPTSGFGSVLLGFDMELKYTYTQGGTKKYINDCLKMSDQNAIYTITQCFNIASLSGSDKPNGVSVSDGDAAYFPFNTSPAVQKVNYKASTGTWS